MHIIKIYANPQYSAIQRPARKEEMRKEKEETAKEKRRKKEERKRKTASVRERG